VHHSTIHKENPTRCNSVSKFYLLYVFFWVITRRLNFICRRFGTLCLFHLHWQVGVYTYLLMKMEQSVPKRRHIKFRRRVITQKKTYNIQNTAKVWKQRKFYFIFIWSSTCLGRHITHHKEPKTALAASGFAYVEGCWACTRPTALHVCKTRGC